MESNAGISGVLKQRFGHDAFLPMQEEVIRNVLSQRDSLVLMPTGSGKSVCYQLLAVRRHDAATRFPRTRGDRPSSQNR